MLGATRLNVYAGIAGSVHDPGRPDCTPPASIDNYPASADLPGVAELRPDRHPGPDVRHNGQLFFPTVGINPEHPFWVPEFVGDTIVVNGKAWPFLNVEPGSATASSSSTARTLAPTSSS